VRVADDPEDERRLAGPSQVLGYEQKVGLARRMVSDNPRQVAQVVRNWVGEDGG
jgi:flagellar M-ring protein FliF